jgi:bifunctional enzyme CysN/CysC
VHTEPASTNRPLEEFLLAQRALETFRFITCGSVDDGKSTLIGRLLHESKSIFDDQFAALEGDSKQYGTQGERLDFALLVDGLQAEREQGITIDVAYRFFSTPRRRYIVADTPGHEQYTRNMATGASTAQLAILLVDARKGILTQTKRHSRIVSLMGIRSVVLAINKMDLVSYSQATFDAIVADYQAFAKECGFSTIQAIPLSALEGDNVTTRSAEMPWYSGVALLEYLDTVEAPISPESAFRFPVQFVNRPNLDFRGYCGRVAAGSVQPGDSVRILPSGVVTTVKEIFLGSELRQTAEFGESITLTLNDEVDLSRGDVLVAADSPAEVADQFEATVIWMAEQPLIPSRPYLLRIHSKEVSARVTRVKFREDVNTGARLAAERLNLNEIAEITLATSEPIVFEPYSLNRILGGFVLIDKLTYATVGAGMIQFALRRSSNIHWQALEIDKSSRALAKQQKPRCIWLTGLSGSGKSTIANLLEKQLFAQGKHTYLLDGDNVRHGLNRDLGFTEADRVENIRRVAEVAKLMVDAGLIVLVSFISPYRAERQFARELFGEDEFIEIFVDCPIEICEQRDTKGLYAKARAGKLANFTGVDSAYEVPLEPEVHLSSGQGTPEEAVETILRVLAE